jgi:hypothetical protein
MSDLQEYMKKRKSRDPKFAENVDSGYEQFSGLFFTSLFFAADFAP